MLGETRNGRPGVLPWLTFAWTVGIAIVTALVVGTGNYYTREARLKAEVKAELQVEIQRDLRNYLPLSVYWQWREETKSQLNQIDDKVNELLYVQKSKLR